MFIHPLVQKLKCSTFSDLDAIELEPRAHGITEVVVKGLKKHGSRIASEAADQAVQGAVQGVVTTVTQRQQRRYCYCSTFSCEGSNVVLLVT